MSDILALRRELEVVNQEAFELDAHILRLLAHDASSEHAAAIAAAVASGGVEYSGGGAPPQTGAPGDEPVLSAESIRNLIDPARFAAIAAEAEQLAEQIEGSRALSERVSRTVRQLDEAQMSVQQALALVEDVVNLKGCAGGVVGALKEDDLIGATGYVRQFHDIASVAAKASEDYERMIAAERELQSKVKTYSVWPTVDPIKNSNSSIPMHLGVPVFFL